MKRLEIASTKSSPAVCFDADARLFTIDGESYPEDTASFYRPILAWVQEYFTSTPSEQPFTLRVDISYCNSSSTKVLMDLFYMLDTEAASGRAVTVEWFYDANNDTALEVGEELSEDIESLNFKMVEARF